VKYLTMHLSYFLFCLILYVFFFPAFMAITDTGLLFCPNALFVSLWVFDRDRKAEARAVPEPPVVRRSVGVYRDNGYLSYDRTSKVIDLVKSPSDTWST